GTAGRECSAFPAGARQEKRRSEPTLSRLRPVQGLRDASDALKHLAEVDEFVVELRIGRENARAALLQSCDLLLAHPGHRCGHTAGRTADAGPARRTGSAGASRPTRTAG